MIEACQSDQEWDLFNSSSPQGSVFSSTAFLNSLEVPIDKLFFAQEGKKLASILLVHAGAKPIFSMYQGICLTPIQGNLHSFYNQQLKFLMALLECLVKEYPSLEFNLSHHFDDLRAFQWINYHEPAKGQFQLNLNYTGIISLKNEIDFDTYFNSIRSVRRYEWRQCVKNEFRVLESTDLSEFMRLYQLTFERQGISLEQPTLDTVKRITESAINNNFGTLTYCEDKEGKVHSASVILQHKGTYYYEFGASDPQFRSSGASVYLMLNNIKNAFEKNASYFDFVGINSPNRGDFKLSFNALPRPYFNVKGNFSNN